ncbi:hypothetical protein [Pseudomonas phage PIP]|nr:hypothetical protein [Pseudomonas phage PIP]
MVYLFATRHIRFMGVRVSMEDAVLALVNSCLGTLRLSACRITVMVSSAARLVSGLPTA